jgi:hypothetical protein
MNGVIKMNKSKTHIIVEIEGGQVTAVTTNKKEKEIDLYVVDWDNIKAGDDLPETSWTIDYPECNVREILEEWRERAKKQKLIQLHASFA